MDHTVLRFFRFLVDVSVEQEIDGLFHGGFLTVKRQAAHERYRVRMLDRANKRSM